MVLKRMSIGELQSSSNEVLLRERMKAIKAGGGGCYLYCGGTWIIVNECNDYFAEKHCGDSSYGCGCV